MKPGCFLISLGTAGMLVAAVIAMPHYARADFGPCVNGANGACWCTVYSSTQSGWCTNFHLSRTVCQGSIGQCTPNPNYQCYANTSTTWTLCDYDTCTSGCHPTDIPNCSLFTTKCDG